MDSKVSYGLRGHADSGVAWIAKCRTRGFLWAGKRCDSRVAVRRRGVRQLAIHATAESPWRAVRAFLVPVVLQRVSAGGTESSWTYD